ncbi:hypothetical protein SIIN_4103_T [Serendipita indica DSM 11827]|nr:hypothetical protein SIIN_4103_T [Serendipita indica DSM 11827]
MHTITFSTISLVITLSSTFAAPVPIPAWSAVRAAMKGKGGDLAGHAVDLGMRLKDQNDGSTAAQQHQAPGMRMHAVVHQAMANSRAHASTQAHSTKLQQAAAAHHNAQQRPAFIPPPRQPSMPVQQPSRILTVLNQQRISQQRSGRHHRRDIGWTEGELESRSLEDLD